MLKKKWPDTVFNAPRIGSEVWFLCDENHAGRGVVHSVRFSGTLENYIQWVQVRAADAVIHDCTIDQVFATAQEAITARNIKYMGPVAAEVLEVGVQPKLNDGQAARDFVQSPIASALEKMAGDYEKVATQLGTVLL